MIQHPTRRVLPGLGLAALALATLASAGCARDRYYTATPDGRTRRVVQRPVLTPPPGKNLFVGGYAGADYSPGAARRP